MDPPGAIANATRALNTVRLKAGVNSPELVVPFSSAELESTAPPKASTVPLPTGRLSGKSAMPPSMVEDSMGGARVQFPVRALQSSQPLEAFWPPPPATNTVPSDNSTACHTQIFLLRI